MRISLAVMAFFVLAVLPAAGLCAEGPFIALEGGGQSVALTAQEVAEGKEARIEAAMPEPVVFLLSRNNPNGVKLLAGYGDGGENLLDPLPAGMKGFDDYDELEDGFSIQVAICDLDKDNRPEVLVATGDGLTTLTAAVYVYRPTGKERFRCIGVIEGQSGLVVNADGAVIAPYGSQGLFTEYTVSADGSLMEK